MSRANQAPIDRRVPFAALGARRLGRAGDLLRLADDLATQGIVVLQGERPGVGATRLAAEYAHANEHRYSAVLWLPVRHSGIKELAADVADALALRSAGELRWPFVGADDAFSRMWRDLGEREGQTLVVLDGFWLERTHADWRPRHPGVHVVAIADYRTPREGGDRFIVRPLAAPDVGLAIARAAPCLTDEETSQVVDALAGDALAVDIALERLSDASSDPVAYAAGLRARARSGEGAVIRDAIEQAPPAAREVLAVLSLLEAEVVPRVLMDRVFEGAMTPDSLEAVIDALVARRLVAQTVSGDVAAHPRVLMQSATLPAELDRWRAPIAVTLTALLRGGTPESRRALAPHARRLLREERTASAPADQLSELAMAVSWDGARRQAFGADEAKRGLTFARVADGADAGALTLRALRYVGCVLSELRELGEAQVTLREALVLAERLHGEEAIEVASVLDELGRAIGLAVCGDAGPEQLALARRALAIREGVWGHDDPKLADHVHSVALDLAVRGLTEDALPLFERAVALAGGNPDSRMLDSYLDSLAHALASRGRVDDAIGATRRALELRKADDGMKYVTNSLNALAHGLAECGRLDALLPVLSDVLAWPEWPRPADRDTEISLAKVGALRARALDAAGRHEEAAAEGRLALRVLEAEWPSAATLGALRSIVERGDAGP